MLEPWRPSADWHQLDGALYRRTRLYDLAWPHPRLDECLVAVAAGGALIALARDPSQLVAVRDDSALAPQIRVYSGAGQLLETLPWETSSVIVALGFTWRDELAVVVDDGRVFLYSLLEPCPARAGAGVHAATPSTHYTVYELGSDASDVGVVSAQVLPRRIVACTNSGTFVAMGLAGESVWTHGGADAPRALAPALDVPPRAWTAGADAILAATPTALVSVDARGATDLHMPDTYVAAHLSPSGRLLALVTAAGRLVVLSADLTRRLRELDLPRLGGGIAGSGARAVAWCGDSVVAVAWAHEVHLVGPAKDPLVLPLPSAAHIASDAGGLRLVSADAHEYVESVAAASEAALRPGSTHPAAILLEASQQAHRSDPHAYEAVRAIGRELQVAVDTCVAAARLEWDAQSQRMLLKAALFGKAFVDMYDARALIETARALRVLNAVRDYAVGIPAAALDADHLLYRLSLRHLHLLAVRICAFLGRAPERVLQHWARAKIAYTRPCGVQLASAGALAQSEDQLANAIIRRFRACGSANYADIAWTAWQAGRARLATLLVEHEVRAVDQVPLLLRMHEHRRALDTAVASGDTDLIYHVLFRLRVQLARGDFFRHVHAASGTRACATLAADLLEVYALEQDEDLARDYYFQDDRHGALAMLALRAGGAAGAGAPAGARVAALRTAARHFSDARQARRGRLCDDEAALIGIQMALEKETAAAFVGLPLVATLKACIQRGLERQAERLRAEFRVSDKRMGYVRVSAYAEARDFGALRELATQRAGVGYAVFVRELVRVGAVDEACAYVPQAERHDRAQLTAYLQRCPDRVRRRLEAGVPR